MSVRTTVLRRTTGLLAALAVGGASWAVAPTPASADTALPPVAADSSARVSADPLPTVQINGVAWSQVVVGTTVYVAGKFTSARPAGAAAGTDETPRGNLLAYDIRTGNLITSFAPDLNAQALVVTASPDGSRIYVGGDFTTADGQTRSRIAAYSTATGALVPDFRPAFSTTVRAVVATADSVYVGGDFAAVGGVSRGRLAAVSAADGSLLPWAPVTGPGTNKDGTTATSSAVSALVLTSGGQVVVGGRFGYLNGTAATGVGALDATTGDVRPFAVNRLITNRGDASGVTSLSTDGRTVWISAYDFSGPGNLEGVVAAQADGGALVWDADCRGDTYSTFPVGGVVYIAGHPHVCSNIGGFPEVTPRQSRYGLAYTQAAVGTVGTANWTNTNFRGAAAPGVTNWYPTFYSGTFTGQGQANWTVSGNDQYVVYGGEFPGVNGLTQQGLVRFAVRGLSPDKVGPKAGSLADPVVTATGAGRLQIAWTTTSDRDDRDLTYRVFRDGDLTTPVSTQVVDSTFFRPRTVTAVDTGLAPSSQHSYVVEAVDATGNVVTSNAVTGTVSAEALPSAYTQQVVADGATSAWPLGYVTGATSSDAVGSAPLTVPSAVTAQTTGAIAQDASGSFRLDGSTSSRMVAGVAAGAKAAPQTFSLELWFATSSTTGSRLAGFGNSATGANSTYDRQVYLDATGRVLFGVTSGSRTAVASQAAYNDGAWHHVVATLGSGGMQLWVDGVLVGSNATVTAGSSYTGYWQVGGGPLTNWPSAGRTDLVGSVDAVAVYPTVLGAATVRAHSTLAGAAARWTTAPADPYGAAVYADAPGIFWRLDETGGTSAAGAQPTGDGGTGRVSGTTLGGVGDRSGSAPGRAAGGALRLDGIDDVLTTTVSAPAPAVFTTELWFSSTSTRGGELVGYGNAQSGTSGTTDRVLSLRTDGRLSYTAAPSTGSFTVTSPAAYNDGAWHHAVVSSGAGGTVLYVDGQVVGSSTRSGGRSLTGWWRVGGDRGSATIGTYLAGSVDDVAVYPVALTADQVTAHRTAARTVPNQAPTAAFTAAQSSLDLAVDGSGSADADGTVVAYAWDFGDGTTSTGSTATHSYAAAGSYTVALTVTDDDGATGTTTRTVTATEPPNQPPAAGFSAVATDLTVSLDGSASSDPDGRVVGLAWDFGDGGTAAGATATHAYAAAGSYTVTLTATDDDGAVGTAVRTVTVTAPAAFAADSFGRESASGWGTADRGGAWTISGGAANAVVTAGAGSLTAAAARTTSATLGSLSLVDSAIQATVVVPQAPTGGGTYASLALQRVGNTDYRVKVWFRAGAATVVSLVRVVDGAETQLASYAVPGSQATGTALTVRFDAAGAATGTTTLRAKVWLAGAAEPTGWTLQATDTTAALQRAGSPAVLVYVSGSATQASTTRVDDVWVGPTGRSPVA